MENLIAGYQAFRAKYATGDKSIMKSLSINGQNPSIMIVSCCDSRVDPGLILQCDPGKLFIVRNVANIVPPFEKDDYHHGTSAALEFAICFLEVKHLILLGHSQCGGIETLVKGNLIKKDDFISNWVSIIKDEDHLNCSADEYAKIGLEKSYQNCLTFPWIKEKVDQNKLKIHLWFFDIKTGQILSDEQKNYNYRPLDLIQSEISM